MCTSSTSRKLSISLKLMLLSVENPANKFASNSTSTKFRFAPNKNPKHVLKAYANSSSTNRKPNMVKPMLLAVENPAIGKNCFHFYQ